MLESEDATSAEDAYRQSIALEPDFTLAYVNLGALLCESGRSDEALDLYDDAIVRCAESALLQFKR